MTTQEIEPFIRLYAVTGAIIVIATYLSITPPNHKSEFKTNLVRSLYKPPNHLFSFIIQKCYQLAGWTCIGCLIALVFLTIGWLIFGPLERIETAIVIAGLITFIPSFGYISLKIKENFK